MQFMEKLFHREDLDVPVVIAAVSSIHTDQSAGFNSVVCGQITHRSLPFPLPLLRMFYFDTDHTRFAARLSFPRFDHKVDLYPGGCSVVRQGAMAVCHGIPNPELVKNQRL